MSNIPGENLEKEWESQSKKISIHANKKKSTGFQEEKENCCKSLNIGFIVGKFVAKKKGWQPNLKDLYTTSFHKISNVIVGVKYSNVKNSSMAG